MDQPLQVVEQGSPADIATQIQPSLSTLDMRMATALLVIGARLNEQCPLEWVDMHESRGSFLRYLESRKRGEFPPQPAPKPVLTWNFNGRAVPNASAVKGFSTPMETLLDEFNLLLTELQPPLRDSLREVVSKLIMRCAHEALIQREALAAFARSMPENAKFDGIDYGRRVVRIGKISSAEVRQHFLSTLPPE